MASTLREHAALKPTRDNGVVLARGKTNDPAAVRAIQTALSAFGLDLKVDGIYGPLTEAVVKAYQAEVGLPVDGRFGPHTLYSLAEALRSGAHHGEGTAGRLVPGLWPNEDFGASVALTFDDGPHQELTPKVLDILNEAGIKGHFFVVGRRVAAQPALVRRIITQGHGVGNHSWDHPDYGVLTAQQVRDQL